MQVRIDRRLVDVIDADCEHRPCFALGFDKGAFTPGVGYTSYHPGGPRPVCWTRHMSGCPHVGVTLRCDGCRHVFAVLLDGADATPEQLAEPCPGCGDTKKYRLADILPAPTMCCDRVDLPAPRRGRRPYRQRCRSCGTILTGGRLKRARELIAERSDQKEATVTDPNRPPAEALR